MQYQKMQGGLRCPNCDHAMQGYSISYHHYECSSCGTQVHGLGIRTNQGLEQIVGVICLIGLVALFANILKG